MLEFFLNMNILFLARRFYPQIGGVEKHVLEIGKRLVKKGHKVIAIAELEKNTNGLNYHSTPKSATLAGKVEGIEIYRINVSKDDWFKKFRIWKELWRHRKIIASADVVHCHDVFFWYLPFRFLFLFKKVYTTFHGYEGNFIPTKKAIVMHKLAEKLSRGNICIGNFFEKWYGTKATYVSFGAVEISDPKEQNKIDKNLIVFLGRLEKETGIMEYLEALNKLSITYKDLRLEVLGNGLLMEEAKEYAVNNHLSVNFRGFIENTAKYIERASFVFVSRYLGILEAMASKKYVLAVYNNKIKEDYLRMTPFSDFISISSNSGEIYKELKRCLADEKQKKVKIDKAYAWVKDKTWDNLVNVYLKLWSTF
jgi:glycosyltransferase involved in cell wall biosynthesis